MRLPAQFDIGPYTIHLDVLAARLLRQQQRLRRWRFALLALVLVTLALGAFAWGVRPWLDGTGVVILNPYPADATLTIDDQVLAPRVNLIILPSGAHRLTAQRPGTFPVTLTVTVTRDQPVTLTLPPLRPIPRVQPVALPSPDATWQQIASDAGGGWRLSATRPDPAAGQPGWGPATAPARNRTLLHLDANGLTRMSVLAAVPVADELITATGARWWASWAAHAHPRTDGAGVLTIDTPNATRLIATTQPLEGLWWAPAGRALLLAQRTAQGQALGLVDPQHPAAAAAPTLLPIPGAVQSVHWQPDGQAVVVISADDPPTPARPSSRTLPATPTVETNAGPPTMPTRSAVLIRLRSRGRPGVTRLQAPPNMAGGALLLAWSRTDLWWGADTGLGLALDRIVLATGQRTRSGPLPADSVALTVRPDGTLRLLRQPADGTLTVVRWPEGAVLLTLPPLPSTPAGLRPGGLWSGSDLLLVMGPTALWYVQIAPEALQ